MLTDEDIKKLIEVFATKEDLKDVISGLSTKEDFNSLMNAIDAYAKKADTFLKKWLLCRIKLTVMRNGCISLPKN